MRLDHVSIVAPSGALEALGFTVTATGGAAGEHARVLLDRVYLEVAPAREFAGRGWFLRPNDVVAAARMLRERGIAAADAAVYQGRDGTWLDVELRVPGLQAVLPTITRRTPTPPEGWPPPLRRHANGARRIAEVELRTHAPARLVKVLITLGATHDGSRRLVLPGRTAVTVLDAGDQPEGLAAVAITGAGDDMLRLELGG